MTKQEHFERLLEKPESSILDFKESLYDFDNDRDLQNTTKFIKDVLSFTNTIRTESAYIIFGVKDLGNGEIELNGIDKSIDDAILHDKVKDKLYPRVNFSYQTINYNSKVFGILEFPITKYELPVSCSVKLKGIEPGKFYYRNGTSNTEATGIDVIHINNWLNSLPGALQSNLSDEISKQLKRITLKEEKLSIILTDIRNLAKKYNIENLEMFSSLQILGLYGRNHEDHKYRIQKVIVSPLEINTSSSNLMWLSATALKNQLQKHEHFGEYRMFVSFSILKIEEMLEKFNTNQQTCATVKISSKNLFEKTEDYEMNVYIFQDDVSDIYNKIRQKTIDELMKV
ncbi:MAG: helix-turn-helix domain-containing protein [Adhaeribacter sp.]